MRLFCRWSGFFLTSKCLNDTQLGSQCFWNVVILSRRLLCAHIARRLLLLALDQRWTDSLHRLDIAHHRLLLGNWLDRLAPLVIQLKGTRTHFFLRMAHHTLDLGRIVRLLVTLSKRFVQPLLLSVYLGGPSEGLFQTLRRLTRRREIFRVGRIDGACVAPRHLWGKNHLVGSYLVSQIPSCASEEKFTYHLAQVIKHFHI